MTPKKIREILMWKGVRSDVGLGVFWFWMSDNNLVPFREDNNYWKKIRHMTDEDLQSAWARFMLEATDEDKEAVLLVDDSHEYDKECGCEACMDYARGEAEYYSEMRYDR